MLAAEGAGRAGAAGADGADAGADGAGVGAGEAVTAGRVPEVVAGPDTAGGRSTLGAGAAMRGAVARGIIGLRAAGVLTGPAAVGASVDMDTAFGGAAAEVGRGVGADGAFATGPAGTAFVTVVTGAGFCGVGLGARLAAVGSGPGVATILALVAGIVTTG